MKFALVILIGLCALTAQAQISQDYDNWQDLDIELLEGKPGFILGLVNGMIDKVKNYVEKYTTILDKQLNQLVDNFVSQVLLLVDFSLSHVNDLIKNAKAELISKRDNNAVACFDKYRPILDQIYTKAKKDVENCVVYALGEIYRVQNNVQKYIDAIKSQVNNVGEILKKCIRPLNPFYTMKCMLQNVSNIMESLKGITSNAFKALNESSKELRKIVSDSQLCVRKVVSQTETQVRSVIGEVRHCLENGVPTLPPTTTEPPTTEPPTTEPSTTEPPTTEPPTTEPSTTEPPTTEPPTTEPPTTEPPTTEPPTIEPSTTEPPTTEPPTTESQTTERPAIRNHKHTHSTINKNH